jgi:hypothetical protein
MKLARIVLATVALLSAAACSSDRITGPAAPQAPAATRSSAPHATILPGDSIGLNVDVTCTTSSKLVNGVLTLVTTCDGPYIGGGN